MKPIHLRYPADIDAVLFDIGGVLTIPDHRRIGKRLSNHGFDAPQLSHDAVHRGHFEGLRAFERPSYPKAEMDEDDWLEYHRTLMRNIGVEEHQISNAAQCVAEWMYNPTRDQLSDPSPWTGVLTDNVEGLRQLHRAGVVLGIVSNNDGTAEQQMRSCGIAQTGEGPFVPMRAIVDSHLAGAAKPDPRIFLAALTMMGVSANRALYVGDTPHCDVRGAEAAGMPVVQLDPFDLYGDFDHNRVRDVPTLVSQLLGA